MSFKYSIPEHWDIRRRITAESDSKVEYELWLKWGPEIGFKGHEFTLQDFEDYIQKLKSQSAE